MRKLNGVIKRPKNIVEKVKRRLRQDDFLYTLTALGLAMLVVSMPAIGAAAFFARAFLEKDRRYTSAQLRNSFYSMRRRGLIIVESKHGKTFIKLTPSAQRIARYQELREVFNRKRSRKWQKKWFVVMFDVSNRRVAARNALRSLLRKFGFAYLQKSAWVFPFDCREEVGFLRSFFGLSNDELRVLVCESIGEDEKMRKHFRV